MQLGTFIVGFIAGTPQGRELVVKVATQLGEAIDAELKKTPLFNLTKKEEENEAEKDNGTGELAEPMQ